VSAADLLAAAITVGVCQRCQCTEDDACLVEGVPCSWVTPAKDLCSACVELDDAELDEPPALFVGSIGEGFDLYSPGTFTAGEGWGPLTDDLRATAAAPEPPPELVISFGPGSKEPS
jgi:hypothetical protein